MRQIHSITSKRGQMVANSRKLWTTLQFISSGLRTLSPAWSVEQPLSASPSVPRVRCPLPVARCGPVRGLECRKQKRGRGTAAEGHGPIPLAWNQHTMDLPSAPPLHAQQALSFWTFSLCSPKTPGAPPCLARNACFEGAHGSASALMRELGGHSASIMAIRASLVDELRKALETGHQEIPATTLAYPGPNPSPRCLFVHPSSNSVC